MPPQLKTNKTRTFLHKIFQLIAQLCSDSTKGSTFCCIQRLLMMSLHVYVTLLNKKILTCLLGKKEMKTSRGNSGPKTQCCCCDLENPFFKNFNLIIQSSVNFKILDDWGMSNCNWISKVFTSFDQQQHNWTFSIGRYIKFLILGISDQSAFFLFCLLVF